METELIKQLIAMGWRYGYVYGHGDSEPAGAEINGESFIIADLEKSSVLIPPKELFKEPVPYKEWF